MYICYLDESGTAEQGSSTNHFVLLGLAIPSESWKAKDAQVAAVKAKYGLQHAEIHTAYMARDYPEQRAVPNFEALDPQARRQPVLAARTLKLARTTKKSQTRELVKNYRKTDAYIHLTRTQRVDCLIELAKLLNSWTDVRAFADAHSKPHTRHVPDHFDMAFEQVVTRFNTFLGKAGNTLGILVQDNNETVSRRLTQIMRHYHAKGTVFASIDHIVETPLFVDSELTSMVQLADLCAYATRRFLEKKERALFDLIHPRFDRWHGNLVGLRHYTGSYNCRCEVCIDHGRPK